MNRLVQGNSNYRVLTFSLLFFSFFWTLRNLEANRNLDINQEKLGGDYGKTVIAAFDKAKFKAQNHQSHPASYFVFHAHNPGIFHAITVFTIKAGAKSPVVGMILSAIFSLIGVVLFYFWIYRLFESRSLANLSVLILATTPFLPYYGSVIHQDPYTFLGFNMAAFGAVMFLETRKSGWLFMAMLGYVLVCFNYWMFHVSTGIFLAGIHFYKDGFRQSIRYIFLYGLVAVVSLIIHIYLMSLMHGGLDKALEAFKSIASYRTLELGGNSLSKSFLHHLSLGIYTLRMNELVSNFWYFSMDMYFILLTIAYFLTNPESRNKYKTFLFIVPAGVSWFLIMVNHSMIHPFAGTFSFFCWILILANFFLESYSYLSEKLKLWKSGEMNSQTRVKTFILTGVILFIGIVYLNGIYSRLLVNIGIYVKNI